MRFCIGLNFVLPGMIYFHPRRLIVLLLIPALMADPALSAYGTTPPAGRPSGDTGFKVTAEIFAAQTITSPVVDAFPAGPVSAAIWREQGHMAQPSYKKTSGGARLIAEGEAGIPLPSTDADSQETDPAVNPEIFEEELFSQFGHDLQSHLAHLENYPHMIRAARNVSDPVKRAALEIQSIAARVLDLSRDLKVNLPYQEKMSALDVITEEVARIERMWSLLPQIPPTLHDAYAGTLMKLMPQLIVQTASLLMTAIAGERRSSLNLNDVLRPTAEWLAESAFADRGIRIQYDWAADLPRIQARAVPLQRILTNLLLNSRDAFSRETPAKRVEIATFWDIGRARVILRVSDTASGIAPEFLPHVFEPGFSTKKPDSFRNGLGLAAVKGLVEDLGGGVEVESKVGRGTTFLVSFPPARQGPDRRILNRILRFLNLQVLLENQLRKVDEQLVADPSNYELLIEKASLLVGVEEFAKALRILDELSGDEFDLEMAAATRVRALHGLGHEVDAWRLIHQALQQFPESFRLYLIGVHIHHSHGQWEQAARFAEPALKIHPKSKKVKRLKAQLLHDLGKYQEALTLVNELLREGPEDPFAKKLQAELKWDLQKPKIGPPLKNIPSGSMRWLLGLVNWVRQGVGLRRLTEEEYRRKWATGLENTLALGFALLPAYVSLTYTGRWEVALVHYVLWAGTLFIAGHLADVFWSYLSPYSWAAWWGTADGRGPEADDAIRSVVDDTMAAVAILLPSWLFLGIFHVHPWTVAVAAALFYLMHWVVNRRAISPIPPKIQEKILELENQGIRFVTAGPRHKEAAMDLFRQVFPGGDIEQFENDLTLALHHTPWDYPGDYLLLALHGEEVLGMGMRQLRDSGREAHLSNFGVKENFRRLGIGRALMGQRMQRILEEWPRVGHISLDTEAGSGNDRLMRKYFDLTPMERDDPLRMTKIHTYDVIVPARGFSDGVWFRPLLGLGIGLGLLFSLTSLDMIHWLQKLWTTLSPWVPVFNETAAASFIPNFFQSSRHLQLLDAAIQNFIWKAGHFELAGSRDGKPALDFTGWCPERKRPEDPIARAA